MTNEEIILKNRVFLMEEGLLKSIEGTVTIADDDGNMKTYPMPEEIHTFNSWKDLGYIVRRGEHSIARFPIWQKSKKKKGKEDGENEEKNGKEGGYYYMKVAFFFTKDQVEPLKTE